MWINPNTGKGWSDREESVIAKIMSEEKMLEHGELPCTRPEAIRRMRRRKLDDLQGGPTNKLISRVERIPILSKDGGRPRKFSSNAERQKSYRSRLGALRNGGPTH